MLQPTNPFPSAQLLLFSAAELEKSPLFLPLVGLMNIAFSTVHAEAGTGKEYLPANTGRFSHPEQLLEEIGPDGFCLVSLTEDNEVIGSMSAKPFKIGSAGAKKNEHVNAMFKRKEDVQEEPAKKRWELLASCVALRVKGKGLASWLMGECVQEIWKRSREAWKLEGREDGKVTLFLSTMQEMNEAYYERRGFTTTNVITVPPGVMKSRDGFHISEMMKELESEQANVTA